MPDEDGYTVPGDLPVGGFAALEGDLGDPVRPLAGFGRPLELEEEYEEDGIVPGGVSTGPSVRYVLRGWS